MDAASVRRVDSAWSVAFVHADSAFLRCLFSNDFVGYSRTGEVSDRDAEIAKALRRGNPTKPVPAFPTSARAEVHGTTAVVGGVVDNFRWTDIYVFENGVWHAYRSVDQLFPAASSN